MKLSAFFLSVFLTITAPVFADPITPAKGTQLRRDVLDAVRGIAEYELGAPVEFVVSKLLVDDDRALAFLQAQRPGGAQIELSETPMVRLGRKSSSFIDGPSVVAFVARLNGEWHVDDYAIGPTDIWWGGGPFCEHYSSLIANFCR